jgi:hypothetical protein
VLEVLGEGMASRPRRAHALFLYDHWMQFVAGLTRCAEDQCPACRRGDACGLDTWAYHLAQAAVGKWEKDRVWSFFAFTGQYVRDGYSVWDT